MKKWWTDKTELHQLFLKRLTITWSFVTLIMLIESMDHLLIDLSFVGLACIASVEFYKDWRVSELNAALVREMNSAYDSICDTCPWKFMAKHGIKPPPEIPLERYKKTVTNVNFTGCYKNESQGKTPRSSLGSSSVHLREHAIQ